MTAVPSSSSAIHDEHREISPVKAITFPQNTSLEINRHIVRCQGTWSTVQEAQGRMGTIDPCAQRLPSDRVTPRRQGLTCLNQSLKFVFSLFSPSVPFFPIIWAMCIREHPAAFSETHLGFVMRTGPPWMKDPFLRVKH